jgi:hypothetical protein
VDKDGEAHHSFAVFFRENEVDVNPKIWPFMEVCPLLWLGDVNYFTRDWHRAQRFDLFVRNIRGRDYIVWGSTHRSKADLQPFVYQYARKIFWVGPWVDDDVKLKELFAKKSAGLFQNFEEFKEKITKLEKFNALNPNVENSVLTIKDETK